MIYTFLGCIFTIFRFPLHGLDSVSESLGKIISNAFKVSVDKLFDVCKHVELTLLINWPHFMHVKAFPRALSALSVAPSEQSSTIDLETFALYNFCVKYFHGVGFPPNDIKFILHSHV